jgi:cytidylate kinase
LPTTDRLRSPEGIIVETAVSGDRIAAALARAQEYWQSNQSLISLTSARAFTVAMTREAGTPGTSVAREVARQLGWEVYDHELLEIIAREHGLRVSLLESVDERVRSQLLTFTESFGGTPAVTEYSYFLHLAETILLLGAHGRCVIVGRGSAFLLPRESTLRVRLIGDPAERVRTVAERRGISSEDAATWVRETDEHRHQFVHRHFGIDSTNPRCYDLILSTDTWTVEETAGLIVDAIHRRENR